ncbi:MULTISPECIES: hypothetical protein [unclassified Variovorax]|uniref:hypothetical protein n=1 Tax=unclassified Variovorax TaxID=663243 RepID=UPI0008D774A9|nr:MULTISPECIES: hypothetical protein [unclassified Variovorax]SEJ58067.1 hypothetical protein SAMN05518853_102640 [Variovorax sp. OK202]SFC63149.1 hypothetical protein SAMN05444746_102640 [Variovorax sp. OK212]
MPTILFKSDRSNIAQLCLTAITLQSVPVRRGQAASEVKLGHVFHLISKLLRFPDQAAMAQGFEAGFVPGPIGWDQHAATEAARAGFDIRAIQICQKAFRGEIPAQISYAPELDDSIPFVGHWPDDAVISAQALRVAPLLHEEPEIFNNQPDFGHCDVFAMGDLEADDDVEKDGIRCMSAVMMGQFYQPLPEGTADQMKPFIAFHFKLEFEMGRTKSRGIAEYINLRGCSVWGGVLIDPSKANG